MGWFEIADATGDMLYIVVSRLFYLVNYYIIIYVFFTSSFFFSFSYYYCVVRVSLYFPTLALALLEMKLTSTRH